MPKRSKIYVESSCERMSWQAGPQLFARRPIAVGLERPSKRVRVSGPDAPTGGFLSSALRSARGRRSMPRLGRRRFRRRRRRGIIRRRLPRVLASRQKVVRGRVCDSFTSAGGAAGAIETRLLNVMAIPDPTSGHAALQFLGYDQWSQLYRKGVVIGVQMTVRVHNKGSVAMMFGICPMPENKSNGTLSTFQHYLEMGQTKTRLLSPDVDNQVLTYKLGTRRWLHVKSLMDEDAFHSTLATEAEPTRTFWITTFFQPVDQATQCAYEAVITYDFLIRLFDPIVPARSTDT